MSNQKIRIALIGTSLLNCIMAKKLATAYEVHIFESGQIGGAWHWSEFGLFRVPIANNLICPLNKKEESYISDIKSLLSTLGCSIHIKSEPLDLLSKYIPNKYILGDFTPAFSRCLNESPRLRLKKINSIEVQKKFVEVDGEKYNQVIFPRNFVINKIKVKGKELKLDKVETKSQHVRARFGEAIYSSKFDWAYGRNYSYTENCDESFDRGGVFKSFYFIGRVRRSCKSLETKDLIGNSSFLSDKKPIEIERNMYVNSRLTDESWHSLKSYAEGPSACFWDTSQFVSGYINHLGILEKYFPGLGEIYE